MDEEVKKKRRIDFANVFSILLLLVGIVVLIFGVVIFNKCNNIVNISEFNRDDLKDGAYIKGYFFECVHSLAEETKTNGVSKTVQSSKENALYDVYSVPFEDNYICVLANTSELRSGLQNASIDEPVYFEGVIRKRSSKDWGFYDFLIDHSVYPTYSNRTTDYILIEDKIPNKFAYLEKGILIICVAVVTYILMKEMDLKILKKDVEYTVDKTLIVEDKRTFTNKVIKYRHSDNLERDLEIERRHFENLCKERKENKKMALLIVMYYFFQWYISRVILVDIMYMAPTWFVLQLIIAAIPIKFLWMWFINSDNKLAVKIAKKLELNTLYFKMIICAKDIDKIEEILMERFNAGK